MADVEKSAVFKVEVDFGNLEANQATIKQKIAEITNAQLQLDVSTKENQKTFKENAATLRALDAQMKLNEKTLNGLSEAEKKNTDQTNFNNNSIKQNRELLKQLNAEYINLANPTKEQTARLKTLTDTLKKQESAIGDNRRSVGGYAEAFQSVLSSIPGLNSGLGGVATGFKSISAANPFTALFLILPPIITYLSKFETIFDALEKVVGGVSGALTGIVSNFSKLLTLDFSGFVNGVSEAASAGYELVAATQDLEDAQRALNVETAKTEAQVKNLIIQSKDRTKTEKERLALLNQAAALEQRNFQQTLKIAEEEKRIADAELARAEKAGTANDAAREKAAQAEIKLIQLQSSSADLQEKITNRKNALIEENLANEQKAAEKALELEKKLTAEKIAQVEARVKIESERLEKLQELKDYIAQTDAERKDKESDDAIEKYQQEIENRQRDFELFLDNEILRADTTEEIRSKEIARLKSLNEQALANTKLSEEQKTNIILKNNKAIVAIETQATQERIQQLNALSATFMNASKLLGEATAAGKTLAIASTIISTYQAAQQAFAALAGIPVVGPGLGAAAAGIAIASGLDRVREITSVDVDGFAGGGLTGKKITSTDGRPIRRSNGDNLLATVKTGEVILNKRQQNALGGASTFRKIGVPGFADGGLAGMGVQSVRDTANIADAGLQPIVDAIKELQIQVSVTEISDVQSTLSKQVQVAEF